jgi:hypothetical protein
MLTHNSEQDPHALLVHFLGIPENLNLERPVPRQNQHVFVGADRLLECDRYLEANILDDIYFQRILQTP